MTRNSSIKLLPKVRIHGIVPTKATCIWLSYLLLICEQEGLQLQYVYLTVSKLNVTKTLNKFFIQLFLL